MCLSLCALSAELVGRQIQRDLSQGISQGLQLFFPNNLPQTRIDRRLDGRGPQCELGLSEHTRVNLNRRLHDIHSSLLYRTNFYHTAI
jgi:hypothetical protein